MLNKIIRFSLKNRLLVVLLSVVLLIGGTYTAFNIDIDVLPDLSAPTVVVMTEAPGMAPEEVEQLVTFPIETAVNGASNVRRVRSSSSTGFSVVWIEFDWGTEVYTARQIVTEKLNPIAAQLPKGVGIPTLGPQTSLLGEVISIGLTSDSLSAMELRTIADWQIRQRLLAVGGVAQVAVLGGEEKEYQILLNPRKMQAYNISLNDVLDACNESNRNTSGGIINQYGKEYIVRGIARTSELGQIGKIVVTMRNKIPIRVADIAEVKIGAALPLIGKASINGKNGVILTVTKQPGVNTLDLSQRLEEILSDIGKTLPHSVHFNTQIFRQERFISTSVHNVQDALMEGAAFVILVLFVFLMSFRTTIISLLAIPLSLLVSIITLKWMGLTINTMSLGGMAIAIGSLVDDAIIDVDNVFKRLKENFRLPLEKRQNKLKVIYEGSREVRASIFNATIIIIVAFTPLFFLSGMEGRLLKPLGIAYIVSLFASLLVALTLTPVLCSFLLTNDKNLAKKNGDSRLVTWLKSSYTASLRKAFIHQRWIVGITIVLLIVTGIMLTRLGRNFLPPFNEGSLVITSQTMPGISLEESDKFGRLVEQELLKIPEVVCVGRKTGRAELDEHALGVNVSEYYVPLNLKKRDQAAVTKEVRERLSKFRGIVFTIGQPIGHYIDHMLSGTRAAIAIKLFGTNLTTMYSTANRIRGAISDIPGLTDIAVEQQIEIPQLQIKPNFELLSHYGITPNQFSRFVEVALGGEAVSDVFEGAKAFHLVVRYQQDERNSIEAIRNTLIDGANGTKIPLSEVAEVTSTAGPNTINRENVQRKLVISANATGSDLTGLVNKIKEKVNSEITLPEGYHLEYGGQFESEAEASRTLLLTSIVALFIVFLLLFHEFRDPALATVILINLPLALIGGVFSLVVTSGSLSIPAIIGFITLFGIATRNGILLISHFKQVGVYSGSLEETIVIGAADRLTPILMTALTAGLALIPLAVAGSAPGNEIQSPMAKVILGGLISSTLLNIYLVPIAYRWLCKQTGKGGKTNE